MTMFSYLFLSKTARTLKYAWAVPVGICYNIKYLYFTEINPLLSAEQCADSVIKFSLACLSGPSWSYLSILSCQCCPTALTCLFCPVYSVLYVLFLLVPFFSLSLDLSVLTVLFRLSFCVLFPDHSYSTVLSS
jgi:hypothetical protein